MQRDARGSSSKPHEGGRGFVLPAGLEALLRPAHARGGLGIPFEAFAAAVVARVNRRLAAAHLPRDATPRVAAALALDDLALAVACEHAAPGAWEKLARTMTPRLVGLARKRGLDDDEADEAAHAVLASLAAPASATDPGPAIARYDGAGSLFAWLAVILLRRVGAARRATRPVSLDTVTQPIEAPAPGDPASRAAAAEAARDFSEALREAWRDLTPREAIAITLKYHNGLKQREIARILDVGAPRVSRLVRGAVAKLRKAMQPLAGDSVPWRTFREALGLQLATLGAIPPPTGRESAGT